MNKNLPSWLSISVLVAIAVGALIILGWVKPYLSGPDLALTSLYRPKPVHVEVETVKWLTKTKTVKERVEIPIEVIREVPVKVEKKLDEDFGIKLLDLKAQNRELVDILAVPRAPRGGEMAVTVSTATGRIDGIFRAHPAPLIELGGLREVGLDYDPLNSTATGYYRQDLLRLGPAIVNAKAFAGVPLAPGKSANVGVMVGVAVRF